MVVWFLNKKKKKKRIKDGMRNACHLSSKERGMRYFFPMNCLKTLVKVGRSGNCSS